MWDSSIYKQGSTWFKALLKNVTLTKLKSYSGCKKRYFLFQMLWEKSLKTMWCLIEMFILSYQSIFLLSFQCSWCSVSPAIMDKFFTTQCTSLSLMPVKCMEASKSILHLKGLGQLSKMRIEIAFQKRPAALSTAGACYVLFVWLAES